MDYGQNRDEFRTQYLQILIHLKYVRILSENLMKFEMKFIRFEISVHKCQFFYISSARIVHEIKGSSLMGCFHFKKFEVAYKLEMSD
jgi:hypothetical protein